MHDLKSEPALSVIRAIGRPEVFADGVSVLVPDDKCLIVQGDSFVVFREPRQIKADLPGQHGQKVGGIGRHVLHFLRAVLVARDAADAKSRIVADQLRMIPAAVQMRERAVNLLAVPPFLQRDLRAVGEPLF